MKKELLTVKELAAELRMSLKSIQRAYRKEEIPVQWLGRMARFDLAEVRRAMKRNGRRRMRRLNGNSKKQGATAGGSRRRAQQKRPRSVKRGLV
jgi:helix-turn-helix protein